MVVTVNVLADAHGERRAVCAGDRGRLVDGEREVSGWRQGVTPLAAVIVSA